MKYDSAISFLNFPRKQFGYAYQNPKEKFILNYFISDTLSYLKQRKERVQNNYDKYNSEISFARYLN